MQNIIQEQSIDEFIFGSNLAENYKNAESLEITTKEWLQKPAPTSASLRSGNLNWKRPSFRKSLKTEWSEGMEQQEKAATTKGSVQEDEGILSSLPRQETT
nr:unnamed protein product [Callosobruchus analis]